jgi:peptidoglycan/xylan/chitin deacetylase (PgdA/CDA1 family)
MVQLFTVALLTFFTRAIAARPVVMFRLDDVQSWWCEDMTKTVVDQFIAEGLPINLGIIAGLVDSDSMKSYLATLASNSLVEMTSHSMDHTTYAGRPLASQTADLQASATRIEELTGITPTAFIPPFNQYDGKIYQAIKDAGFSIMSAECAWWPKTHPDYGHPVYCPDGSNVVAPNVETNGIYSLPTGAVLGGEAYWTDYQQPADFDQAVGWIEAQIGTCITTIIIVIIIYIIIIL